MSAFPKCPYCGGDLEGFTSPEEGEEMAKLFFDRERMTEEIAQTLERELDGSSTPYPDALVEWRKRHPKTSSPA